jgi:hypothetical protein
MFYPVSSQLLKLVPSIFSQFENVFPPGPLLRLYIVIKNHCQVQVKIF